MSQEKSPIPAQRRSLVAACLAHLLHDGFNDLLYVLLPLWRAEFGLSYAALGIVRALYYGTMGGLQVPANQLTSRFKARTVLAFSTFVAAAGYLVIALPGGFPILCVGMVIAGIGASLQHPRGSLLVTDAYGTAARGPLGIYNFAGDLGKSIFPPVVAFLLTLMAWRPAAMVIAGVGLLVGGVLLGLVPRNPPMASRKEIPASSPGKSTGFRLLLTIGALDTAPRMGYLLFLPFLLHDKGGTSTTTALGLALLFLGGALGKAACGWLGHRLGVIPSVIVTETVTGLLIAATLVTPLGLSLVILPLLGIVLNGTSSVLYGTVPELAPKGEVGKGFALFYTAVIGSGGVAPIVYGVIADHSNHDFGVIASALTAIGVVPFAVGLRRHLK